MAITKSENRIGALTIVIIVLILGVLIAFGMKMQSPLDPYVAQPEQAE